MSIHTDGTDTELATRDIYHKMRKLVESFIAQDVCLTLGDSVDSLRGMECYNMILILIMLKTVISHSLAHTYVHMQRAVPKLCLNYCLKNISWR